jgi:hypothetical protein
MKIALTQHLHVKPVQGRLLIGPQVTNLPHKAETILACECLHLRCPGLLRSSRGFRRLPSK